MWDSFKNFHEKFHERIEEMQRLGGLRIWILHVLDDGPKNGVEIMDSIEEHHEQIRKCQMERNDHFNRRIMHSMKHGTRRPSPGSVYPMLKKMVDEKLISKKEDGRYELTDKGQEITHKVFGHYQRHKKHMDRSTFAVEHAITEIDSYVSYLEDIKKEKLISHKEIIGNLSLRLKKLKESFDEN